jgi:hypothetical protein
VWNGLDTFGRIVAFDSFYTKAPGCQSAEDRVVVENQQRPRYFEFVTLDAQGFQNPAVFSGVVPSTESYKKQETLYRAIANTTVENQNGSTGVQTSRQINQNTGGACGANGGTCVPMPTGYTLPRENYADTRARQNFEHRRANSAIAGYRSACNACQSGNN